jgi:chromosome partitioning protein
MKTLGILSRKGGVGKTTLALHLAVLAQQAGRRTLLIDLDPQRSAAAWWRARDTPLLVETEPEKFRALLDSAEADGIDLMVIDTRPSAEADAVHVATLADLIVVGPSGDPGSALGAGHAKTSSRARHGAH